MSGEDLARMTWEPRSSSPPFPESFISLARPGGMVGWSQFVYQLWIISGLWPSRLSEAKLFDKTGVHSCR